MELCQLMVMVVWMYSVEVAARRVMKSVTGPTGGFSSLVYHPGTNGAVSRMSISFSGTQLDDNFAMEEPITMNKEVKQLMHTLQIQHHQQQKSSELHYKRRPITSSKILSEEKRPIIQQPIHQMFRNKKLNLTKSLEAIGNLWKNDQQRENVITKPSVINRGQNKYQSINEQQSTSITTTTTSLPITTLEINNIPSDNNDYSKWMSMKVKKENQEGTKFHASESAPNIITFNNRPEENEYFKNLRKPLVTQESLLHNPITIFDPMSLWKSYPLEMPEVAYTFSPDNSMKINQVPKYPLSKYKKQSHKLDQKITASEYVNKIIQNVMNKTNISKDPKMLQFSDLLKTSNYWKPDEHTTTMNFSKFEPENNIFNILKFADIKNNQSNNHFKESELIKTPETNQNSKNKWSTQIFETMPNDKFVPIQPTSTSYNNNPKYSESLKNKFLNDPNLSKLILNTEKLEKMPDEKFVLSEPSTSTFYKNRIENIPKYPETLKNRFLNDESLSKLILTSKNLKKIPNDKFVPSEAPTSTFYNNNNPRYTESLKNKFFNDQKLAKLILSSKKLEKIPDYKFVPSESSNSTFFNKGIENISNYPETSKNIFLNDQKLSQFISNLGPNSKHEYQNGKHIITGPEEKGVFFRIIVNEPHKESEKKL